MLDDDPEFLNRFDATVAKRILKLMTDLGLTCLLCFVMGAMACGQTEKVPMQLGNAQTDEYLPLLLGRQVALVGNHTSMVGDVHLVDITTEGVVQVRFEGECLRCPSRDMTLRSGIETTLCNRLQDITGVEEVQN